MSVLASLLMAGCSQDDVSPVEDNGGDSGNGNGESTTSYMAVNLVSPDTDNTVGRATEAADGYEDGSSDENTVNNVRFYFFDGAGGAAYVKLNGSNYVNYYDWENPTQSEDTEKDDIEKILSATIVISTKEGDKLPQMVAAVINPPKKNGEIVWGNGSKTLTDLQNVAADYAAEGLTTVGNFVMFNSIYVNGSTEVNAVPIASENLQKKQEDAKKNPVTIFVERSVAKVRVNIDKNAGFEDGKLALKSKDGNTETPILVGGKQVYLKLDGWSLTADTDNGRLVKKINPAWQNTWWKGEHRTFWAINDLKAKNQWHTYNEINTAIGASMYTNENAAKNDGEANQGLAQSNTKVILKGTLCDEAGASFTIVRHLGAYFADTYNSSDESKNLTALKNNILTQLVANNINYYYGTTETQVVDGESKEVQVRKQIEIGDIKIVIAGQLQQEEKDNNCYVYAQLTDVAAGKTWYDTLDETASPIGSEEKSAAEIINDNLKNSVDKALVWNSGMTYYYYEIKHLKNDQNQYLTGVVRNHIYETNVTKILGLGTPVYDPTQKIYPEKPSKNDHYIAAEIKILSWRVVNNDYVLDWD